MPIHKLCILSCLHLRRELVSIVESEGLNDVQVVSFPADCRHSQIQWDELRKIIEKHKMDFDRIEILAGHCISSLSAQPEDLSYCHVSKMDSCFHMLAPQSLIDSYIKNGGYLLTPGWLAQWRHCIDKWDIEEEAAKEFFHESAARLVLLDTGTISESYDQIQDFSDFLGLPFDIMPVGLDYLKLFLKNAFFEWQSANCQCRLATLGKVIGAIAHQWRQPLNAVGLIIQDIQDCYQFDELDQDGFEAKIDMAMTQLLFMSKTLEDFKNLLQPSKLKASFDVLRALAEALSIISVQFIDNFILLKLHCQIGCTTFHSLSEIAFNCEVYVCGHPNEFKQVILNLLNNSKDAILEQIEKGLLGREDGMVILGVQLVEDKLTITITDNAGGIRPTIADRIFEPYFTTKEQGRGTGIGLYMSKIIIENNMNGKLYAENSAEGARFIMELPANRDK